MNIGEYCCMVVLIVIVVDYCSLKPYCLYHEAQNKRHVYFVSHPWMIRIHFSKAESLSSQKTMRLRVFCNYFMYTLIAFTTLINIAVSPFVVCVCVRSLLSNMTSEKSWEQQRTEFSSCCLWIKRAMHVLNATMTMPYDGIFGVFAVLLYMDVCVCVCVLLCMLLLRFGVTLFALFHMLMDDWN